MTKILIYFIIIYICEIIYRNNAKVILKIRLFNYKNSADLQHDGRKCENFVFLSDHCDPFFTICVTSVNQCDVLKKTSKVFDNRREIYMVLTENIKLDNLQKSIAVHVKVDDKDSYKIDHIAKFRAYFQNMHLNYLYQKKMAVTPRNLNVGLHVSVSIKCSENFYGENCDKSFEEYKCSSTCVLGNCQWNSIKKAFYCQCDPGWTGHNCNNFFTNNCSLLICHQKCHITKYFKKCICISTGKEFKSCEEKINKTKISHQSVTNFKYPRSVIIKSTISTPIISTYSKSIIFGTSSNLLKHGFSSAFSKSRISSTNYLSPHTSRFTISTRTITTSQSLMLDSNVTSPNHLTIRASPFNVSTSKTSGLYSTISNLSVYRSSISSSRLSRPHILPFHIPTQNFSNRYSLISNSSVFRSNIFSSNLPSSPDNSIQKVTSSHSTKSWYGTSNVNDASSNASRLNNSTSKLSISNLSILGLNVSTFHIPVSNESSFNISIISSNLPHKFAQNSTNSHSTIPVYKTSSSTSKLPFLNLSSLSSNTSSFRFPISRSYISSFNVFTSKATTSHSPFQRFKTYNSKNSDKTFSTLRNLKSKLPNFTKSISSKTSKIPGSHFFNIYDSNLNSNSTTSTSKNIIKNIKNIIILQTKNNKVGQQKINQSPKEMKAKHINDIRISTTAKSTYNFQKFSVAIIICIILLFCMSILLIILIRKYKKRNRFNTNKFICNQRTLSPSYNGKVNCIEIINFSTLNDSDLFQQKENEYKSIAKPCDNILSPQIQNNETYATVSSFKKPNFKSKYEKSITIEESILNSMLSSSIV